MSTKLVIIDGVEYTPVPKKKYSKELLTSVLFPCIEIEVSDEEMTWDKAMEWCKLMGGRALTKEELQGYAPQLEALGYKCCIWSASSQSNFINYAWFVNLGYGSTYSNNKYNTSRVICVRP